MFTRGRGTRLSLPAGLYTIEVSAADTSGNTGTGSVTVDVLKLLSDCFGILGDEDFTGDPDSGWLRERLRTDRIGECPGAA